MEPIHIAWRNSGEKFECIDIGFVVSQRLFIEK